MMDGGPSQKLVESITNDKSLPKCINSMATYFINKWALRDEREVGKKTERMVTKTHQN
jgi:hypothetical protein